MSEQWRVEVLELYYNGIRKGVCGEVGCKEGCWIWGWKNWRLEVELGLPWHNLTYDTTT